MSRLNALSAPLFTPNPSHLQKAMAGSPAQPYGTRIAPGEGLLHLGMQEGGGCHRTEACRVLLWQHGAAPGKGEGMSSRALFLCCSEIVMQTRQQHEGTTMSRASLQAAHA